jgi:stage III sporulation protein AD
MNITQIVAFGLVATFIIVLLKQYKSEYAIYASVIAGATLLFFAMNKVGTIINLLENLVDTVGINKEFFRILLKITGIAYLVEFASNMCKDAGESAISSKIELAGKLLIVTLSIPIISTLVETITEII